MPCTGAAVIMLMPPLWEQSAILTKEKKNPRSCERKKMTSLLEVRGQNSWVMAACYQGLHNWTFLKAQQQHD